VGLKKWQVSDDMRYTAWKISASLSYVTVRREGQMERAREEQDVLCTIASPPLKFPALCGTQRFITVGFEVLTAVSMKIAVFWVVAPSSPHRPDDGGSKDL
jgi:hypothetical protein